MSWSVHTFSLCITMTCSSDLAPVNDTQKAIAGELPRKKSRNYLDSHKNIEKKRRDRINQCLNQLKTLVPDCRQYVGSCPYHCKVKILSTGKQEAGQGRDS